jgi:SsrA-binding protein
MAKHSVPAQGGERPVATNRRARRDFDILDTIEVGVVLAGSEVKSLRDGKVQLADAYARFQRGELFLHGVTISQWSTSHGFGAVPADRARKLLAHRHELDRLQDRVMQEHLTLVPLSFYFRDGRAKIELGLAKGRKTADKRQALAERDAANEARDAMGRFAKGLR